MEFRGEVIKNCRPSLPDACDAMDKNNRRSVVFELGNVDFYVTYVDQVLCVIHVSSNPGLELIGLVVLTILFVLVIASVLLLIKYLKWRSRELEKRSTTGR